MTTASRDRRQPLLSEADDWVEGAGVEADAAHAIYLKAAQRALRGGRRLDDLSPEARAELARLGDRAAAARAHYLKVIRATP